MDWKFYVDSKKGSCSCRRTCFDKAELAGGIESMAPAEQIFATFDVLLCSRTARAINLSIIGIDSLTSENDG